MMRETGKISQSVPVAQNCGAAGIARYCESLAAAENDVLVSLVLRIVALDRGTTEAEMLSRRRCCVNVVRARHVAIYLLHTALGLNYREVGEIFARNRRTIARACAGVERARDRPQFDAGLVTLESMLELIARSLRCNLCRDAFFGRGQPDGGISNEYR